MMINRVLLLIILIILPVCQILADDVPTINPVAIFVDQNGNEEESSNFSGSAPLKGIFHANAENVGAYQAVYEWRFTLEGQDKPYLVRYDPNTEYTFSKAGTHNIVLYATFVQGSDTISFTQDYWSEVSPIRVTISESLLEMPNAFSPNNDDHNDVYRAKKNYKSLVEFHASIFNRWGQKLYEWDDPSGGWDGKYKGKDVKEGVYFVVVNAKGADGRVYHIRKDVNLLRGYTERTGSSGY